MTDSTRDDAPQVAAEATAGEPSAEPTAQAGAEPATETDAKPGIDEVKRKFREALDAKRQTRSEGNSASGRDAGRIHGARGPAGGKRAFRRKSG